MIRGIGCLVNPLNEESYLILNHAIDISAARESFQVQKFPYYDSSTFMTFPQLLDESYRELRELKRSRIATELRRRELAAQDLEAGIRRLSDLKRHL